MATKSHLPGTITDSSVGRHQGAELKYAGYDTLVITGKERSLSYLYLNPERAKIMVIGPGGENRVPFACVSSERCRQLGRGAIGAVLGSKNLKGIAVRDWLHVTVPDLHRYLEVARELQEADAVTAEDNEIIPVDSLLPIV